MYINNFSARIPEGKETPGGYVEMEHDTQYTIVLRNNRNTKCEARVEIDGKHIGTFRINAYQNMRLERPAHDTGKLTFYKVGTSEAKKAGISESDPNTGLVKVVFTPAKNWFQSWSFTTSDCCQYDYDFNDDSSGNYRHLYNDSGSSYYISNTTSLTQMGSYEAGGTGLSGKSDQNFVQVPGLILDCSQQTTIHLRLVAKSTQGPRPLTSYSTPVPPPIK